jgi:thymidylate synthase (FAD)
MNEMIGKEFPVLDHGFIRLVDHMGGDLSIVRAARVSYNAAWRTGIDEKSDERLIHYLWENGHTTPFEAVTFTIEVMAPIFVIRQWHRHRIGWSYNELSGRYKEMEEKYYVPKPEHIGTQSKINKQGRDTSRYVDVVASGKIHSTCAEAFVSYRQLLARNVPREVARMVLPVSTYSHMFATTNLLAAMRFMTLRHHEPAQLEIQWYSMALQHICSGIAPIAMTAWGENK